MWFKRFHKGGECLFSYFLSWWRNVARLWEIKRRLFVFGKVKLALGRNGIAKTSNFILSKITCKVYLKKQQQWWFLEWKQNLLFHTLRSREQRASLCSQVNESGRECLRPKTGGDLADPEYTVDQRFGAGNFCSFFFQKRNFCFKASIRCIKRFETDVDV